ncbi:Mediator complex, subunit Med31 [Sesbania bispinosa]|nr:Mediator complex, subunit Med31 [Sesbania bispinosa]
MTLIAGQSPNLLRLVECSNSMASKTESENSTDTTPSSAKNIYKDPDDGRQRFLLELEFVQCLANPTYIHYLAQNRYFEDEAFIGYLKYLQYWQRPEYIKFIMYPHCLYFLELLQNANFRNAMAHPSNKELAHRQQFYFWKNYRNNRLKHILPRSLPEPSATPAPPAPTSTPAQAPVPALPPVPATNVAVTASSTQAPSPMPYGIPPGSALAKNDMRNPTVDRRKRK